MHASTNGSSAITVLLVEDQLVYRRGLRAILEPFRAEVTLIDEATNAADAVAAVERLMPDVVLLDLGLPANHNVSAQADTKHGLAAISEIRRIVPSTLVLVLSHEDGPRALLAAMGAGAMGYIPKREDPDGMMLVQAIRQIKDGEPRFGAAVAKLMVDHFGPRRYYERGQSNGSLSAFERDALDDLSDREHEVLALIADEMTNSQIADQLHISIKTVKTHVSNILTKLQVNNRTEARFLALLYNSHTH